MLGLGDHFYSTEMINKDAHNDSRIREMSLEEEVEERRDVSDFINSTPTFQRLGERCHYLV